MFLKPWREKGECHENFLATTGEGSSDPHYTWGALMALIAMEELIDANPWHGLRFGNLSPVEEAGIERYPVGGAQYDVKLSPEGMQVKRDGKALFSTNVPVEIRHVVGTHGEIRASRAGKIWIAGGAAREFPAGISRV